MQRVIIRFAVLAMFFCVMANQTLGQSTGKPVNGKDYIYAPAIGDGLCVQNLFQSNMVLQREKPINVWGWAAPGETVTVTFDGKEQTAKAAEDRSWKVTFPSLPASEQPRTMEIKGADKSIKLENILIGEVWLSAGQSNMEFALERSDNGDLEIASAHLKNLRLLKIPAMVSQTSTKSFASMEQWSDFFSEHQRKGFWMESTPQNVREFATIGYVFARRLQMAINMPVGIIDISRGGTCVETWTPIDALRRMENADMKKFLSDWDTKIKDWDPKKALEAHIAHFRQRQKDGKVPADAKEPTDPGPSPEIDMNRPGNCFGGNFAFFAGLSFRGVIWHQGYNNALTNRTRCGETYAQTLTLMIKCWRETVGNPEMAFGVIAQETQDQPQSLDNFLSGMTDQGCYIREAHWKVFDTLRKAGDKNVGYAASDDMRRSWYHPQIKIPVGERIARWAMATQYGIDVRWLPPTIKEYKADGNKMTLKLDNSVGPYNDGPINGFMLAGNDKKFYPATAAFFVDEKKNTNNSIIILTSPYVAEPVAYRYGWHRNPMGNLKIGASELPLPQSRSDNWSLNDLYEAYSGKKCASDDQISGAELAFLRSALGKMDKQRRFMDAETYVNEHQADKPN